MYSSIRLLSALYFAITACTQGTFETSSKRGLVFTPNSSYPNDDKIWTGPNSDLTWYYNYGSAPSPQFASIWGAPTSTSDNNFLTAVMALVKGGRNITHVLAFNEPDGTWQTGGSGVTPELAAQTWEREIIPLQKMGIKVGAPAMQFPGVSWLNNFTTACSDCTFDFIPLHFYGDKDGFAWHVNEIHTAWVHPPFNLQAHR
jgi:hypothetical protein